MSEITIYTQPNCPPCRSVKNWFNKQGVEFVEKDVTTDPDALVELANLGFQGTPVIYTPNDAWVGIDLKKMKALL